MPSQSSKRSLKKRPPAPSKDSGDAAVFAALKRIIEPFEAAHHAIHKDPGYYYIETREAIHRGKPLFLAAVRRGKSYVSFHLMPVYGAPQLLKGISPELKRRMQGKACFNFKTVDDKLFAELENLTQTSIPKFLDHMAKASKEYASGSSPQRRRAGA